MRFVIRLSSELAIKSSPVRKRWTKLLTDNIRAISKKVHSSARVAQKWDRIELSLMARVNAQDKETLNDEQLKHINNDIVDRLSRVPGIANFSQVQTKRFDTLADIYDVVRDQFGAQIAQKTFRVRVRRIGSHSFSSADVERFIGGSLNEDFPSKGVALTAPDITLKLEIDGDMLYQVVTNHEGLGGYPVGSQESVLSLISGGFDSTVASFQMIKRGLRTHYCFFNLGGSDHELAVKEIAYYLWQRYGITHKVRFINVPFEGVVNSIVENVHPSLMGVVLKRMMLRAAQEVSRAAGIEAIVTGESVAQVSSQTIPNLAAIDEVTDMLVLRPLIVADKGDIIDIARKIGADAFCEKVPEYCGVISVKPSAKVDINKVHDAESQLPASLIDDALKNASVRQIHKLMDEYSSDRKKIDIQSVTISDLPDDACVIDIRHPTEQEIFPLKLKSMQVLTIPFYSLSDEVSSFDQNRRYYLYCAKGVMSTLHARHLQNQGYTCIGVCRP